MTPFDHERLLDLIVEWDELRRRGQTAAPEELCPEDSAMQLALRDRIAQRLKVERMIEPVTSPLDDSPARVVPLEDGSVTDHYDGNPLDLPERIGRYRVERLLGSGGFGLVFLAHDDELKRRVAIKVPYADLVKRPEHAELYRREAQSVASLDHPHIVPVYDVGSTERYPCFIVSKYISGTSLSKRMKQSHLSFLVAADIVATMADALHYAHTRGLVHRDVKPLNILMSDLGEPFLVDFGLALREQAPGDGRRFAGTPAYMSPEQARGEAHRVDGRSDIFSLGVVFYELLVGRKPFQAETRSALLTQVTSVEPKPPRQIDDSIPKELERICLKALAKRASDRYTTALDLAEDLRQFLSSSERLTTDNISQATFSGVAIGRDAVGVDLSSNTSSDKATEGGGDSDRVRTPKIVPRGLRSFDEHDAEFFLQLLPGPRDRAGLPDSIRFWKTRIEQRDPNETFAIGMIYGPSGCGKTSLVKAGLLPRLSADVISVYLEATTTTTESRLLNGVRRRCPELPGGLSLLETFTLLRQDREVVRGRKVLLVIDQLEQWLHARPSLSEQSHSELIEALRQCDGEHLQCIVLVRDDFWMAATRFARELEISLVDGFSTNAVDLFPMRHARQVLIEFGRAFNCLADSPELKDPDQALFVDRAVSDLAENGLVVPVRLVVFAEMMKEKPWSSSTLKQVGGINGVGVTFLEATFSGLTAPATHRYHQRAAQSVLRALLPEAGIDIKGHVRTYAELLSISGYGNRVSDFEDLIRILNRELRLVTLTDPFGASDDIDSASKPVSEPQCFQLTHDYLVPSLKDWLTRKQKETRRGRAELQLAERAASWNAQPSNRLLPTLTEFVGMGLLTDSRKWTSSQRQMMIRAGRWHATRWGGLLAVLLLIALGIQRQWSSQSHEQVKSAVDAFMNSSSMSAPTAMRELWPLPRGLVEQELRSRAATSDQTRKLRLAFAQSELGDVDFQFLISKIETASAEETDNLIVALGNSRKKALAELRTLVDKCDQARNWLLKARLALVSLYLGDAAIASEMCRIEDRPDPIQRTCFIESFCAWPGDVVKLVEFARPTNDIGLRSALCMGLSGMAPDKITNAAKLAWNPVFTKWFQTAPDGVTHSAAGLPLLFWGLEISLVDSMTHPDEARDWYINSVGMTLMTIPPHHAGRSVTPDDSTKHPSLLLMSDREVSMGQVGMFLADKSDPLSEKPIEVPKFVQLQPTYPAHQISWHEAIMFCNWLSRREGFTCYYERADDEKTREVLWRMIPDANGYRLPLESEWEMACRAGTTTPFSFGEGWFPQRYANLSGPILDHCAIRFPNGWGLFDMHGNAAEWCNDAAPPPSRRLKQIRGGDMSLRPEAAHSSSSWHHFPEMRFDRVGFRVCRVPRANGDR